MDKKTYYNLLTEYQELIKQKQFNEFLCNRSRMNEVKKALCNQLERQKHRAIMDAIYRGTGYELAPESIPLIEKQKKLLSLIDNEAPIETNDFCNTYIFCGFENTSSYVLLMLISIIALFILLYLFSTQG